MGSPIHNCVRYKGKTDTVYGHRLRIRSNFKGSTIPLCIEDSYGYEHVHLQN